MSQEDLELSSEDLAVLMGPSTLAKIDGILWPTQGPDLIDLMSGGVNLRKQVYECAQFGISCSYVWHPMSAIARMPDGGPKASLLDVLQAELNDSAEEAALRRFMASAPRLARAIDGLKSAAAADGELWPEVWNLVACDLWTFLECGFQPSQVRNGATLEVCEETEGAIMQLAFEVLHE